MDKSLLVNQNWHTEKRNVKIGDVVTVQDSKQICGNWRLASVSDVFPSDFFKKSSNGFSFLEKQQVPWLGREMSQSHNFQVMMGGG